MGVPAVRDQHLATLLEVVADEAGDAVAVVHGEVRRSWRELDERAARLARYLADAGHGPGSRIAVGLRNGPEYVETVFAVMKLRAAVVNVNVRYREGELRGLLEGARAAAFVFDGGLDVRVAAALPLMRTLIRVDGPGGSRDTRDTRDRNDAEVTDYEAAVAESAPMERIARSGADEWLMFTGGTTGRPKGVVSRHRWLIEVAEAGGYRVVGRPLPEGLDGFRSATRELLRAERLTTLVAPPLTHATGLYASLGCLLAAGTVVFPPGRAFDPMVVAAQIAAHRVRCLSIVGDAFAVPLADAFDAAAASGILPDLSTLVRIRSAGMPWSAAVKARLLRHCDAVLEDLFAATEGGPFAVAMSSRAEDPAKTRYRLLPGCRVVGADGRDVVPGSGSTGFLAAPAVDDRHYLDDPEATARAFRSIDGRLHAVTGDLVTIEADGALTFLGRADRVINTGGHKVFAEEVEQVIAAHPQVRDTVVVGVPDPRWGERITALVALEPGAALTAEHVKERVRAALADYKTPKAVVFTAELRRTATGKPDIPWARSAAEA